MMPVDWGANRLFEISAELALFPVFCNNQPVWDFNYKMRAFHVDLPPNHPGEGLI